MKFDEMKLLYYAAAVGVACGFVSEFGFGGAGWFNLAFWAIAGGVLGLYCESAREARTVGLVYGAILVAAFMLLGFRGVAGQLPAFLMLTVVLALLGALCGWLSAYIGFRLRR